jgi:serine/threonine-protein kinase
MNERFQALGTFMEREDGSTTTTQTTSPGYKAKRPGIGTQLERYVLSEQLGEGGQGAVYRAWDTVLERDVAIKVLLLENRDDDQSVLKRCLTEASIAAKLRHPGIVQIFDVGVHESIPYFVMECLEGRDLETLIYSQGPIEASAALDLVLPIVDAVAHAHEQRVLHRDLKPANVLVHVNVRGEVVPKILDFGIARLDTGSMTEPTRPRVLGTPSYLAPESVLGEHRMNRASDCFGLGAILYECVTGHAPYEQRHLLERFKAVEAAAFPPPRRWCPDLDVELEDVILRAMHRKPEARFQEVTEFGRMLLRFADPLTDLRYRPVFGNG